MPWRVSRNGDAGKCERCKNVRKRGTEMMKCRVCAWRICATCHNCMMRGEAAEPPPEMRQTGRDEVDELMAVDGVHAENEVMRHDEEQNTLESLRRLSERNMPNTITFIPTPYEEEICSNLQCQDKRAVLSTCGWELTRQREKS